MPTKANGEFVDDHVPYNTAPMSREERFKEMAQSGTGTPLANEKKAAKKQKEGLPAKKKTRKEKAKAKMGGGMEPT